MELEVLRQGAVFVLSCEADTSYAGAELKSLCEPLVGFVRADGDIRSSHAASTITRKSSLFVAVTVCCLVLRGWRRKYSETKILRRFPRISDKGAHGHGIAEHTCRRRRPRNANA